MNFDLPDLHHIQRWRTQSSIDNDPLCKSYRDQATTAYQALQNNRHIKKKQSISTTNRDWASLAVCDRKSTDLCVGNIYCMSMPNFIKLFPEQASTYYTQRALFADDWITTLVDSCYNHALIIYIPKKTLITDPFIISSLRAYGTSLLIQKIIIFIESDSYVVLHEQLCNEVIEESVIMCSVDIILADSAQLIFFANYAQRYESTHYVNTRVLLQQKSQLDYYTMIGGSVNTHINFAVHAIGEHSHARIRGAYVLKNTQQLSFFSKQHHAAAATTTDLCINGIVYGSSLAYYQGTILIDQNAHKSCAEQINKNIIMHSDAHVQSIPQLEVLCHDVHCAHGSAIGQLDTEQLFYLQSRGLTEQQARQFLIHSFFAPLLMDQKINTLFTLSSYLEMII